MLGRLLIKAYSPITKRWDKTQGRHSWSLIRRIETGSTYVNSLSLNLSMLRRSLSACTIWLRTWRVTTSNYSSSHSRMSADSCIFLPKPQTSIEKIELFRFTFLLNKLENVVKQKSFPMLTTSRLINIMILIKPVAES